VIVEFSKPATERDVLLMGQLLSSKQKHKMFSPRLLDFGQGGIIDVFAEINAADFSPDSGRQLLNVE
jgi:hypothetical protein